MGFTICMGIVYPNSRKKVWETSEVIKKIEAVSLNDIIVHVLQNKMLREI